MINERRKFSRIPIPAAQADAVLRVGSRNIAVRLLTASPVGFAIACPASLAIACGELLPLHTDAGWVEVRVIRAEPFEKERLLGLARVRDLADVPNASWPASRRSALFLAVAALMGIIVGAALLTDGHGLWRQVESAVHSLSRLGW